MSLCVLKVSMFAQSHPGRVNTGWHPKPWQSSRINRRGWRDHITDAKWTSSLHSERSLPAKYWTIHLCLLNLVSMSVKQSLQLFYQIETKLSTAGLTVSSLWLHFVQPCEVNIDTHKTVQRSRTLCLSVCQPNCDSRSIAETGRKALNNNEEKAY